MVAEKSERGRGHILPGSKNVHQHLAKSPTVIPIVTTIIVLSISMSNPLPDAVIAQPQAL